MYASAYFSVGEITVVEDDVVLVEYFLGDDFFVDACMYWNYFMGVTRYKFSMSMHMYIALCFAREMVLLM